MITDMRTRRGWALGVVMVVSVATGACGLTGKGAASTDAPAGAGSAGSGAAASAPQGSGAATGAPATGSATTPPSEVGTTTVDPGTLPQTEAKPTADDAELAARLQAMWDGIVEDDAEKAMPFFFPLGAYKQIKDLKDPTADWNNRLVATYKREIHDLHKALGKDPSSAKLLGIDIPTANAQWIKPGVEYNKGPYWRVFGTKVRYSVNGKTQSFVVQSLISWRGQWYVVHLTAPPR